MDMTKIVNKNEEKDISHLLGDLSGEEMIKLAEMPFTDLVEYMKIKLKKSVLKGSLDNIEVKMSKSSTFASKLINSEKHMEKKKREAYPEPEPEPESEPRPKTFYGQQSSSSISRKVSSSQPYSSYYSSLPGYRYKRSPEPEPEPESEPPLPRYQSQSGQADGGYQSKTRYTYGGYLHMYKRDTSRLENNDVAVLKEGKIVYKTIYDKLTDMVKTTKLNRRSKRSASTINRK